MSRISYRNYPILKYLNGKALWGIPYHTKDDFNIIDENIDWIESVFIRNKDKFKSNICLVSNSFIESLKKAESSLDVLFREYMKLYFSYSGTMIAGKTIMMYHLENRSGFYDFTIWTTDKYGSFSFIGEQSLVKSKYVISQTYIDTHEVNGKEVMAYVYSSILKTIIFKEHAEVEVVYSKAKSKTKEFGCKYVNETDLDIEYLDSKWFTTLINSNSFNVRGHFRLQPKKKDGVWVKELIWIEGFEKKGYNRTAKIMK